MNRTKKIVTHSILAVILIIFDQITKLLVLDKLQESDVVIWKNVFRLTFVRNTGAAWGMLKNGTLILTVISILISVIVIFFYLKLPTDIKKFNVLRILLVFVLAGAMGNIIDRIRLKYVVDFLYFELIDFPVFNVADCYITVSMILLAFLLIFYYKEEDFSFFSAKKNSKTISEDQPDSESCKSDEN